MSDVIDIHDLMLERDGEDCTLTFRVHRGNEHNRWIGPAEFDGPEWMTAQNIYESLILLANRIKDGKYDDNAEVRRPH